MNGKRTHALPCFLAGLAAGIAVTILVVPRSGAGTRQLIGRKVRESEDWMKTKAAGVQDYVSSRGAEWKGRVKEAAEVLARKRDAPLPRGVEPSEPPRPARVAGLGARL